MSSSNKIVIEKQQVVKERVVVDLTHLDDESLDESGKNDTKYEEMSESDETIQNNKDGNTTIVLQQMYRWKDVPFPWEIQRMMVSRVQRKFSDEFLSLGFKKGAKDEIFKGKMSDIHSMLMMVTSSYQPSNAINTYKEHDDFLLCPFCKSNHWKFKGLHDHAKAKERQNSLPHKAMRLYLDEVHNYIEVMMVQTNKGEWTSLHSQISFY